jgi:hypothetical protein
MTTQKRSTIFLDSFSGSLADLKPSHRTSAHALQALANDGRVSTFDRSEYRWLDRLVSDLMARGLIAEVRAEYPWHRYVLTGAGISELKAAAGSYPPCVAPPTI